MSSIIRCILVVLVSLLFVGCQATSSSGDGHLVLNATGMSQGAINKWVLEKVKENLNYVDLNLTIYTDGRGINIPKFRLSGVRDVTARITVVYLGSKSWLNGRDVTFSVNNYSLDRHTVRRVQLETNLW